MQCRIIEVKVPLDTNIEKAVSEKQAKSIELISHMQNLYNGYTFRIVVVAVGELGAMPKILDRNLRKIFPHSSSINVISQRIQKAAISGTLKVSKMVMGI